MGAVSLVFVFISQLSPSASLLVCVAVYGGLTLDGLLREDHPGELVVVLWGGWSAVVGGCHGHTQVAVWCGFWSFTLGLVHPSALSPGHRGCMHCLCGGEIWIRGLVPLPLPPISYPQCCCCALDVLAAAFPGFWVGPFSCCLYINTYVVSGGSNWR